MFKLNLYNSLFYERISPKNANLLPNLGENEEQFLCFDLDPAQSCSIEPDKAAFLGSLLFIGHKTKENAGKQACKIPSEKAVTLPQGNYLVVQQRGPQTLKQAEWLKLAIEQQKDGLWERNKLGNKLYVRYLHEDGAFVTQIFREIKIENDEI